MTAYSFTSTDDRFPAVLDCTIEISVFECVGLSIDQARLESWAVAIAQEVAAGNVNHEELVEDRIKMKIVNQTGEILVDTISSVSD